MDPFFGFKKYYSESVNEKAEIITFDTSRAKPLKKIVPFSNVGCDSFFLINCF